MSRFAHLALLASASCLALLLPAPAAAIDVCGNGICHTTTIPRETPQNCPEDCGGGAPPSCVTDTCLNGSCSRPAAAADADLDGVKDRLEFDLAHQFFPSTLLQWQIEDLNEAYLFKGRSTPFVVQPYFNGAIPPLCDQIGECLEIRWGMAFFEDHGDGGGAHQGDSEMYAALLRRDPASTIPADDPAAWQMIRDFTSAHWGDAWFESSRVAAYGFCQSCSETTDLAACDARSSCHPVGYCQGWSLCPNYYSQSSCQSAGCTWLQTCHMSYNWGCDRAQPFDANTTIFAAESKHALYHSDSRCDSGGLWNSDDCPNNQFDLRDFKAGHLLQNVGQSWNHTAFDTTIQDPSGCGLYSIWGGAAFGEASPYNWHFTTALKWALD